MDTEQLIHEEVQKVLNSFEANRQFKVYFPEFNFATVIKKYNKKYGIKTSESFLNKSDTKLADMLGEDLLQKILRAKILGPQTTTQSV